MVERYNGVEVDPEGVYVMFEDFERLTAEVSALRAVYAVAKHHIDVRLPAEPGFDEAVFAADKYYESTPPGSPDTPEKGQ